MIIYAICDRWDGQELSYWIKEEDAIKCMNGNEDCFIHEVQVNEKYVGYDEGE
jgi:hypothetical protein